MGYCRKLRLQIIPKRKLTLGIESELQRDAKTKTQHLRVNPELQPLNHFLEV